MDGVSSAPILQITPREVVAVEHPMIIKNIDKGLKTFGNGKPFERVLHVDDPEGCLPLYLRHDDPMCVPILSHNSPTNNILLKITVPKRTGKRKRGSQDPYSDTVQLDGVDGSIQNASLSSAHLLRTLRDNAGQYEVEAVAEIDRTHRFRGLADFHHSTVHSNFSSKFQEFVLPGEVEKMRQFKFDPSRGWKKNEEFMPPPAHTNQILPFNWGWHQNPQLTMEVNQLTGETTLVHNESTRKSRVDYVPAGVVSVPQSSPYEIPQDRGVREVIAKLTEALNERPVWTRRALGNRIGHEKLPVSILKALHHVVYQFKGGPFRDAVIKYGIDPRTDKKYRNYQTVFFQIYEEEGKGSLKQWKDVRTNVPLSKNFIREDPTTHIFDGKTLALDGKIWQLCDITDPLLVRLIKTSTLRDEYEPKSDGYFSNGAWAKIHAIMRIKLIAIRANATLTESDLEDAINVPDVHDDNRKESRYINVPVPDIRMTGSEAPRVVEDEVNSGIIRPTGIRKRRKLRYMRISQNLAKKRSYVSQKPIPAQSRPGVRNQSKKMPQGNQETRSQEQIVPTDGHNAERAATGINSSRAEQRESTSAEYLTAEENADHTREGIVGIEGYVEEDEGEDDEREFEDEDSENRESDEDSGDEGVGNDEDGLEDREDLEGDFYEEEYDSEATDVVDFTT